MYSESLMAGLTEKRRPTHVNLRNAKGDSSVTSQKNAQNIQKMDIKRREELFKKVHFVIVLISFAESSDLSFVLLMDFDTFIVESI